MDSLNAYYVTFGWMSSDRALGLKGTELKVYALVHTYSQAEQGCYFGSLRYTAEMCGCSQRTAIEALNSLVDKGLIRKRKYTENNVEFCQYIAVKGGSAETAHPMQKLQGGSAETAHPMQKLQGGSAETAPGGCAKIAHNNKTTIDNKKTIKSENTPAPLILPFSSDKFRMTWEALCEEKEWKKKTRNALQLTLNKLGKYHEDFAIELMEATIESGKWQRVVFPDTDAKYQEWKSARQLAEDNRQPRTTPSQGKPKQINPNNQVDAFYREKQRKEEEERARLIAELKAKHGVRDDNANDQTSG